MRQTDPERGQSPWRRGVRQDRLVLICPGCQESADWTAELEHCAKCRSAHLIRRLGQVECLDCGLVRDQRPAPIAAVAADPAVATDPALTPETAGRRPAAPDGSLAEEVSRALDRLLGRA